MADWLIGEDGGLVMGSGFVYEPGSTNIGSPSKNLMFNFEELGEMRGSGTLHPSVINGENLIGLRLGKRTYFEDAGSVSNITARSGKHEKKTRSSSSNGNSSRCQVEGCNLDLSSAKDYHRRHRVCESHTKSPKVIVGGLERRFCQQCSRFHGLAEFDENKRSCRRRLSDHNARRRKPQPEAIQLPPSLYDGRGHLNLAVNRVPFFQTRSANPPWEDAYDSGLFQLHHLQLADTLSLPGRLGASSIDVSHQGYGGSPSCSAVDSTQDLRRALSLLSTTSAWNPRGPECAEEMPLAPPAAWRSHQHSGHGNLMSSDVGQFQEFQLFKPPYEPDFCSNYRMN